MHPSVVLAVWFSAVLLTQVLPSTVLAPAGVLVLALAGALVRRHFAALLKRSKWILLTLFLTFVFLTPGERWLAGVPVSHEGLLSGGDHLMRLLSVLLAVAWLVGGRSTGWLLSAMWGALGVFRAAWATRFIVRLALTLRYAGESDLHASWRKKLTALEPAAPTTIEISHVPMQSAEQLIAFVILLGGACVFLVSL
jgi:hypothetical protein